MTQLRGLSRYWIGESGNVYARRGHRRGRILKPYLNDEGYPKIKLVGDDGVRRAYLVHLLVARAFLRPPADGEIIRHRDNDRTNAGAENLTWGTKSENERDKRVAGTHRNGLRRVHHRTRAAARRLLADGQSVRYVSRRCGISEHTARKIRGGLP